MAELWGSLKYVVVFLGTMWAVHIVGQVFPLQSFGIRPRSLEGLLGILFSPLLHGSWQHLLANSTGVLVLGGLLFTTERKFVGFVVAGCWVFSGLGVWLVGSSRSVHIGASGLIYGLIGYFIAYGFYSKKAIPLLISLATLVIYGGAVWGVLPKGDRISWEAHLSGFLGGIAVAAARSKL